MTNPKLKTFNLCSVIASHHFLICHCEERSDEAISVRGTMDCHAPCGCSQ